MDRVILAPLGVHAVDACNALVRLGKGFCALARRLSTQMPVCGLSS